MTTEGLGAAVARRVPAVVWAGAYRRADLIPDLLAGVAVTALLVPHGMAYAELAGVPVVTGLYTTVLALLAYAVFGPSRILMLGPDSSLAPLIAAGIALVGADGDPARAVATAGMLALFAGLFCVVAGLTGLGVIADLLSKPVRVGFLNGLAIVMVVGQLPKLFGFSVPGGTTLEIGVDFVDGLIDGATNGTALTVGAVSLAIVFGARRFSARVPGVLVAVVAATLAVVAFDLVERGVQVVGAVPEGFPRPDWPGVPASDLPTLALSAAGIALMTLTDTTALSRGFADRTPGDVDPDREIVALGAANLAAGMFQGFPISASTSRTTLVDSAGGRTQLVGVVGALLVLLLVVVGGGLVEDLPTATLAALVIAAGIQLFDFHEMRWLLAVRRSEFIMSFAATAGVVALGVLEGVGVAIVLSLLNFVRRVWRPYDAVLGRVEHRNGFHDVERHPDAERLPGLLIYRFDAPLFFANAEHFARRLRAGIDAEVEPVTHVVVSAEPMTDIDTTGAEVLGAVLDDLDDAGIQLSFAGLKGPVKDRLAAYGLDARIGKDDFYSTLDHAIREYSYETGIEWED